MKSDSFRQNLTRLFALLSVLGLLAACTGEAGDSPTEPGTKSVSEVEYQSYQLVNSERKGQGVDPQLKYRDAVAEVARAHSESMRDKGFFGHRGADGGTLVDRLNRAGIPYRSAAENLVKVTASVAPALAAHNLLMESGDHRDNILNPKARQTGVGVAKSGNTYWITQIFIRP